MKKTTIDVYSNARDNGVVRMPDRQYIGSVVQGDSLFLLHGEAMDIIEELKHNPGSYAYYKAYSIAKNLEQRLDHYISVCKSNQVKLDFNIEFSVLDYDEPL